MEGEGGREEEAPEEDGGGKRENIVNIPNYYVWGIRDIDILRRAFLVWRFLLYPKATLSFIWRHNVCLLPPLPAFSFAVLLSSIDRCWGHRLFSWKSGDRGRREEEAQFMSMLCRGGLQVLPGKEEEEG